MPNVEITLNSEKRKFDSPPTLEAVLKSLPLPNLEFGVAACLNGEVVDKTAWGSTQLRDGDTVEILRAFQGG